MTQPFDTATLVAVIVERTGTTLTAGQVAFALRRMRWPHAPRPEGRRSTWLPKQGPAISVL